MTVGASLSSLLPAERVLTRALDRAAFASDASFYTLTPRAVVRPVDTTEIKALLSWSRQQRVPLTFRAAGTSLSGQAVTDGVLVDLSRHWRTLEVLDRGARVRVGPGVVGGLVNARLAPYGAKIGPDPASIAACMIGGIVANNSSGMCCGTEHNAYKTLESLRFVLPSGTEIDSAAPDAEARLAAGDPGLVRGLTGLRDRVRADARLVERIRSKYRIKNTMGYALNAFLDFDTPLEILWHLLVGSEGTLGFIAEAVFRTVPDLPLKSTGLLVFSDVPRACDAIEPLAASGAKALELMDRASLRSITGHPGIPDFVAALPSTAAAILAEYQASDEERLVEAERAFAATVPRLPVTRTPALTRDPAGQARLWSARKGLTATIGAMRPLGTSMIFEDVAFPLPHLASGVTDLQRLFAIHHYPEAIVFGHAKDGNVHFIINQSFNDTTSIEQYERFTGDLVEMVVGRYDGSLKAEHGTGRNMAPFLEREWGADAYALMREIKRLIDPDGILNPGVLLNDDARAHVTHLKSLPCVDDEIDRCIECGFCESRCPSRDLTLTPRQRIVLRREEARRRAAGDAGGRRALEQGLRYALLDTCATDGLCATACPVGIDTGALVKKLRGASHGALSRGMARSCASHLGAVETVVRHAWRLMHPRRASPRAGKPLRASASRAAAVAVYFPSCVTRALGGDLAWTIDTVAGRAGVPLFVPGNASGACCGLPFSSKGYDDAHALAANRLVERMWSWSDAGRLPVVIDNSPCAWSIRAARPVLDEANRDRFDGMRLEDGVRFAHDVIRARLPVRRKLGRVAVHPVCSLVKAGLAPSLTALLGDAADDVFVPVSSGCCGFAGDRGFTHPELTRSATAACAAELRAAGPCDAFVSSSRTCEIAMSRASGFAFESFWTVLERASDPDGGL